MLRSNDRSGALGARVHLTGLPISHTSLHIPADSAAWPQHSPLLCDAPSWPRHGMRPPVRLASHQTMSVTVVSRPLDVCSDDRERVLGKIKDYVVDWLDQLAGGDLPRFEVQ